MDVELALSARLGLEHAPESATKRGSLSVDSAVRRAIEASGAVLVGAPGAQEPSRFCYAASRNAFRRLNRSTECQPPPATSVERWPRQMPFS